MMVGDFWELIDQQLDEIGAGVETFDGVRLVLGRGQGPDATFFAGSGGDRTLAEELRRSGWEHVWGDRIFYVMRHPVSGEVLTYIEGDVVRGDQRG
ncbi:hypothetical protein [Microbacterium sp. NPDC089696]|uniref:hypothetical protein n=1 Tax=Microbacterium sp. NPDC089696 TaxID=3364199 RepID=UPI0037FB3998